MAWNPTPEVAVARDAAVKLKAPIVVIFTVTKDGLGYVSYGQTRKLCRHARDIAERMFQREMKDGD